MRPQELEAALLKKLIKDGDQYDLMYGADVGEYGYGGGWAATLVHPDTDDGKGAVLETRPSEVDCRRAWMMLRARLSVMLDILQYGPSA